MAGSSSRIQRGIHTLKRRATLTPPPTQNLQLRDRSWSPLMQVLEDLRLEELDDDGFQQHHYPRPKDSQSAQKLHRVAGEVSALPTVLARQLSVYLRS